MTHDEIDFCVRLCTLGRGEGCLMPISVFDPLRTSEGSKSSQSGMGSKNAIRISLLTADSLTTTDQKG